MRGIEHCEVVTCNDCRFNVRVFSPVSGRQQTRELQSRYILAFYLLFGIATSLHMVGEVCMNAELAQLAQALPGS
jgi:hypothetical protein